MSENWFEKYLDLLRKCNDNPKDPEVIRFVMRNYNLINPDAKKFIPQRVWKYMITFTIDPKKQPKPDLVEIEKYIVKLLNTEENFKFYYALEHADTNAHWHCIVYRTKHILQDKFKYYKTKYGNIDISKSFDLSDEHSLVYLGKESVIKIIKGTIEKPLKKQDNQPLNLT